MATVRFSLQSQQRYGNFVILHVWRWRPMYAVRREGKKRISVSSEFRGVTVGNKPCT